MNQKILGCLLGAAVGDAMGAATETKSTRQIEKTFGGRVKEFREPPMDTMARGRRAGQVTDAFSIPYILTECRRKGIKRTGTKSVDGMGRY